MIRHCFTLVLIALMALPASAATKIQDITSPGGIKAWLVEEHSLPFVAIEILFHGGTSLDAPSTRGATNLMVGLLEEGAGDRDARAFSKATEELAAQFSYDVDADEVTISAQMLTENRDEALTLLRDSLIEPRFDQDAIERVRGQILSIIGSDKTDPNKLATQGLSAMIYGDHPYASSGTGTIDSVKALTRDDLVAAHRSALSRDQMVVSAVGDITPDELAQLLDQLLEDLPASGAAKIPAADVALPGGVTVQDFDTPQSVVVWAQEGIQQTDPDFFAAYVLNQVLGASGFGSRLMTEVREKRGLTYGVYSYLYNRSYANIWLGSMSSANDRVAEAIDVVRAQWQHLHDNGVTAKELEDAKTYLTGAYPLRFDGNARIAGILSYMQAHDFPIDYALTRNDKINAVTLEDVSRVARERLNPEQLTFYVVGQPVGLESDTNTGQ